MKMRLIASLFFVMLGASAQDDLMFIHHSCGQNWLDNSLRDALDGKSYIDAVNEITYGDEVANETGRPASLGEVAGELTDMNTWLFWFNDYFDGVQAYDGFNRVIMFKSCFPNSHISEVGTEPGDPFGDFSVVNFQAVYRHPDGSGNTYTHDGYSYLALEDVFAANPNTLFIPVTAPPECYRDADATSAANARTFNNWLKGEWLTGYKTATGLNNVAVFDWFNFLANPDDGLSHANMLKAEYGGSSGDSHPNNTANAASTELFATDDPNFIDTAWAAFNTSSEKYLLTMTVAPEAAGTTNPAAGEHSVTSPQSITATAGDGYVFVNWTGDANASFTNADAASTIVTLTAAAAVTANFAEIPAEAVLTMTISPAAGGETEPEIGNHTVATQTEIEISATAAEGYSFVNWTSSGSATLASSTSAATTVTLLGAGAVTATFTAAIKLAPGSVFDIEPADLTEFDGDYFAKKPKVTAHFEDPLKFREKRAPLKVCFDKANPESAQCEWKKIIKLYNKKDIPKSQDSLSYLESNPIADLECQLVVQATDPAGYKGEYRADTVDLCPPLVTGIQNQAGETITSAAPGSVIRIIGQYFGVKPPKAWLEYEKKDKVKAKKCKLRKELLNYRDAKGKPSCMDIETGVSSLPVELPAPAPENRYNIIVIDNKTGRAAFVFTVTD